MAESAQESPHVRSGGERQLHEKAELVWVNAATIWIRRERV